MAVDLKINQFRRRFMKASSITVLQALFGNIPSSVAIEGKPTHHTSNGFRNYPITSEPHFPGVDFFVRRIKAIFDGPKVPVDYCLREAEAISSFYENKNDFSLTWIGHSTFLLRIKRKTILLDPFFSDIAGPIPLGPKRYVKPGIQLRNLPQIDMLILSHSHYDHLDEKAIERLQGKEKIEVYVPLGLKSFFRNKGYIKVKELDWYDSIRTNHIKLTALPAIHFSSRGIWDRNKTLWCSWAIQSHAANYFFAGDTAYSPTLFKEIGKRYKSFDLAIVPIGAYEPQGVMKPVHTSPEEAIRLANDIGANTIIPCHWGTIELSDEPPLEPPERFVNYAARHGIPDSRARIMKIGETI